MSEVVPMKGDERKPIEVLHVRSARCFHVYINIYIYIYIQKYWKEGWPV